MGRPGCWTDLVRTSMALPALILFSVAFASEPPPQVVIPALGSDEATPVVTDPAETESEATATALRLRGYWMGFEVIIFERPEAGYVVQGETLRTTEPAALPANLTSRDAVGERGAVVYPPAQDSSASVTTECTWLPSAVPGATTDDPLRTLFASPPSQEALDLVYPPEPEPIAPAAMTVPDTTAAAAKAAPNKAMDPLAAPEAPVAVAPDPRVVLQEALVAYEAELTERSLVWLAPDARRLDGAAARLAADGGYRVLLHEAWIQNLAERGAPAVLLMPDPDGALIGFARVVRQRGARLRIDIAFRGTDAPVDDPGYLLLADERRIGRGTYYIDHPRLGVIVRATEVGIPPALQEAFAALTDPQPAPAAATPVPTPSPTP